MGMARYKAMQQAATAATLRPPRDACTPLQQHPLTTTSPVSMQTSTSTSANMYAPMGVDNSWSFREFVDNMQIKVNRLTKESMEFELIGVDPAIANALRRILIAEVPTIAIEHVFIINNTSVIQVRARGRGWGRGRGSRGAVAQHQGQLVWLGQTSWCTPGRRRY